MVVLDEQLSNKRMLTAISAWYRGNVIFVKDLRPRTLIKDDVIPQLLRRQSQPTFVTVNVSHFWQKVPIDQRFCVVCFDISDLSLRKVPSILRLLFSHQNFKYKSDRAGHVFCVNADGIARFYSVNNREIQHLQIVH